MHSDQCVELVDVVASQFFSDIFVGCHFSVLTKRLETVNGTSFLSLNRFNWLNETGSVFETRWSF